MKKLTPAAGCLRMSSDKQDTSLDDQKTAINSYCAKFGLAIVRWYIDEGISGDTDQRRGFKELIKDVQTVRDFEVVLVWDQERFSRMDILDVAAYWKILRDAEVKIVAVKDGREIDFNTMAGVLVACINQHGAHDYLKTLSKNTSRGQTSATRDGCWSGSCPPDGYVSADAVIGGKKRRKLQIDELRAAIVRQIYQDFLDSDLSYRGIASRLNARGILNSDGQKWTDQGIQCILQNEAYVGRIIRGRRAAGKYTRTIGGEQSEVSRKLHYVTRGGKMKAKSVIQNRCDWIITDNAHELIIDQVTFERVQAKIKSRRESRRVPRQNASILSGLLYCGHCHGKAKAHAFATPRGFIRCRAASPGTGIAGAEQCCCCFSFNEVVERILSNIENDRLSDRWINEFRQEVSKALLGARESIEKTEFALKASLASAGTKLAKAESRLAEIPDDMMGALVSQIRDLREQRQALEAQLAAQSRIGSASESAIAADAARYIEALRSVRAGIRQDAPDKVRAAIAAIVYRIELISEPCEPNREAPRKRRQLKEVLIHYKPANEIIAEKIAIPHQYAELLCQGK